MVRIQLYRLLFTNRQQEAEQNQAGPSGDDAWKLLWKMEVPPKVRVFLVASTTWVFTNQACFA
jgi:hypothetical protein